MAGLASVALHAPYNLLVNRVWDTAIVVVFALVGEFDFGGHVFEFTLAVFTQFGGGLQEL